MADAEYQVTLPRRLRNAVVRLLRPAETATRRLVFLAARDIAAPPVAPRSPPAKKSVFLKRPGATGILLPRGMTPPGARPRPARLTLTFALIDPPRRHKRPNASNFVTSGVPRILFPGVTTPMPVPEYRPPTPFDRIDARHLALRLGALARTLDDLPAGRRAASPRLRG